ncbi:MAG TPA: YceI family protein [Gammaproteobacteria bacterium]|jgi:hypothetical protein
MERGKVIAAVIVVGMIGLVIAQRLEEPGNGLPAEESPPAGAAAAPEMPADARPMLAQADTATGSALPATGETRLYTIDAAQSEVYWRIYRAGAAARLGHNHIISMPELAGSVTLGSDLETAQWDLRFAVDSLVIDDPELRSRHGEDFESVPSEDDKAGTKRNMLTDRVLNGEIFPEIRLSGTGVSGTFDAAELPLSIEILGRTIEQTFPASIEMGPDSLTVTGEFRLTHDDLGMEPFSAFGGIMAVGNDIDFTYRIHAVAGG